MISGSDQANLGQNASSAVTKGRAGIFECNAGNINGWGHSARKSMFFARTKSGTPIAAGVEKEQDSTHKGLIVSASVTSV